MNELNEQLLHAWLSMITQVDSERIACELPYNEAIVCNMLYMNQESMTARELCKACKMAKSLMNRSITSLEQKQLIKRVKDANDKRQIKIQLLIDSNNAYAIQHQRSLQYVNRFVEQLGVEKVSTMIELFNMIEKVSRKEKI